MRKILSNLIIFWFLIPTIWCIAISFYHGDLLFQEGEDIDEWSQRIVISGFSEVNFLKELAPSLLYSFGTARHDGIFITPQYLLEDIFVKDDRIFDNNLKVLNDFCENSEIPAYICIVPTAIAIKQQELPKMATIYNQKLMITGVYDELFGKAEAVDAYSALFSAREQYLYYRTEPRLTGLGGYYVYLSMGDALGFVPYELNKFKISHTENDVYGTLYKRVNNKKFPPDVISRYEFTENSNISVTHRENGEGRKYYSLFPKETEPLKSPFEISLGGYSKIMETLNPFGDNTSLLILGDESASAYLPFLALNFKKITFLDLNRLSVEELLKIKANEYSKILFCYSAENFLNEKLPPSASILSENK